MAIHYYREFADVHGRPNFGDDLNPWLLPKLFAPALIASTRVCIVGIGTLLNRRNAEQVARYRHKVVFASGYGYGDLFDTPDASWDFACVRGPLTAAALNLPSDRAISDGALLLHDFVDIVPAGARDGVLFVPHASTHVSSGRVLRDICHRAGVGYLSPTEDHDRVVGSIARARLLVTEAMHGAIVADALRTPWVPVRLLHHNRFKWEDWCASVELPYRSHDLRVPIWDAQDAEGLSLRALVRAYKARRLVQAIAAASRLEPMLSHDAVLADRLDRLRATVAAINSRYAAVA